MFLASLELFIIFFVCLFAFFSFLEINWKLNFDQIP